MKRRKNHEQPETAATWSLNGEFIMNHLLLIMIGSGIGGICRYWLSTGVYQLLGKTFPYGTFTVNAVGSFLIGFLSILFLERIDGLGDDLRAIFIVGFLGGFTTFSTFSIETLQLLESGEIVRAVLNVFLSTTICVGLAGIGALLARQL